MMRKAKERELALKVKFEPNAASVEETLKILEPKILECEKVNTSFIFSYKRPVRFYQDLLK